MAIETGDLYPRSSGSASLGAEQVGVCGFTDDIRPFCHAHINSGVFHDPLQGQSGVIRYSRNLSAFEASVDGGLTFDVMMTSGQIDTGHSIERAYVGGNEMYPPLNGEAYQGIAVLEPTPLPAATGQDGYEDHLDPIEGHTTYGLAISGAPPLATTNSSLMRLGSHWMHMRSSGTLFNPANGTFLGYDRFSESVFQMASSGAIFIETKTGSIDLLAGGFGDIDLNAGSNIKNQASGFISLVGLGGNVEMSAGFNIAGNATNDVVWQAQFQTSLEPFLGSGKLQYHFGPYEAWHVNPSTNGDTEGPLNNGYFPMPHSGQILQMILETAGGNTSLQDAYLNGSAIFTDNVDGGAVSIQGDISYGLFLSQTEDEHPHLLVSGVMNRPSSGYDTGVMWLQGHSAGEIVQLQGGSQPSNRAEASAKSLGIDTWFMETGSGIVSLRAASGVSQFFNVGASQTIDEDGLIVPLNTETTPSTFYHVRANSGVQIFVPGLYKIHYSAIIEKPTGNLAQGVVAELRMRDKWGQEFKYLGSESAAILRDSNDLNENSCVGQTLVDIHAGDSVVLFVMHNGSPPAGNTIRAKARSSNMIVEWIGPLAGGTLIQQSV